MSREGGTMEVTVELDPEIERGVPFPSCQRGQRTPGRKGTEAAAWGSKKQGVWDAGTSSSITLH